MKRSISLQIKLSWDRNKINTQADDTISQIVIEKPAVQEEIEKSVGYFIGRVKNYLLSVFAMDILYPWSLSFFDNLISDIYGINSPFNNVYKDKVIVTNTDFILDDN